MYYLAFFFYYFFPISLFLLFFFFNDTATTEIYTLSLHDALPISPTWPRPVRCPHRSTTRSGGDRKSTRLNSSHVAISYAVFCLKKKKKKIHNDNLKKKKKHNNHQTEIKKIE